MSVCDDVMEWVELGASLHTPQSDLNNIEHTHGEDPACCRRELFKVQTLHTMYIHCICILCLQVHVHVHVCSLANYTGNENMICVLTTKKYHN